MNRKILQIKSLISPNFKVKLVHFRCAINNFFCAFLPMKNEILLESYPDLSCNTYALYTYMIDKKINDHFHIVWMVDDPKLYKDIHVNNVEFIKFRPTGRKERKAFYIRCNRAKAIVCCNRHIKYYCVSKKQLNIYIEHGSPFKKLENHYLSFSCRYCVTQSPFFTDSESRQYHIKPSQILPLGLPRNDLLFKKYDSIQKIFEDISSFDKVIIWVPTFREHKNKIRTDCHSNFPLGIPILYSEEDVKSANAYLAKSNMLIIVKPHPAQDLDRLKGFECSNIRLLDNDTMQSHGIQTNELLAQTDAMIGDYSGIYYDYLLLDKPIGITLDDFEDYKRETGFVFDDPLSVLAGKRIYNLDDLVTFLSEVERGEDPYLQQRAEMKKTTNVQPYNQSTKRVFDFLNSELKFLDHQ